MKYLVSATLVVVGVIHLLPLSGVLSSAHLTALYGLPFDDPNLAILMRHRAVLFGLLGLFLVYSAFQPAIQVMAFVAGFFSVVSFLWLAYATGDNNSQIARVVIADIVALACLIIGAAAYIYAHRDS